VGSAPLRLVDTPDGVWVSVISDGKVVRIDPATGKIDKTISLKPANSEPEGLAWDGSLWVVDQANSRVVQYDRAGTEVRSVDVGEAPRLATAGESGIWVTNYLAGSVTLVADGQGFTLRLDQCIGPQGVAEVAGKVWVACTENSLVVALDVETRKVVTTIENVPDADAVAVAGDTVYVVGQSGPTVYSIDAASGELRDTTVLGDVPRTTENVGAAVVGDELVVTHPDVRTIYSLPLP
jgi:streptogramin lyase